MDEGTKRYSVLDDSHGTPALSGFANAKFVGSYTMKLSVSHESLFSISRHETEYGAPPPANGSARVPVHIFTLPVKSRLKADHGLGKGTVNQLPPLTVWPLYATGVRLCMQDAVSLHAKWQRPAFSAHSLSLTDHVRPATEATICRVRRDEQSVSVGCFAVLLASMCFRSMAVESACSCVYMAKRRE